MKIRIQPKGLKNPQLIEDAQSVVVYDEHGNPIFVSQQIDKNTCLLEKAGQPDFERLLRDLGIGLNSQYVVVRNAT
jgi:hypothetical protein